MGVVSLFGDMAYEGARGLVGPYLGLLGASATAVGFAAGLGEFVGYGLRLATGWLADRTGAYWPLVVAGYAVNLVAVPLPIEAPACPVGPVFTTSPIDLDQIEELIGIEPFSAHGGLELPVLTGTVGRTAYRADGAGIGASPCNAETSSWTLSSAKTPLVR
jgi:hypothetical protein